jgi:uncharacterized protein
VEKSICADAHLSKLDSELKAIFDEAQGETAGVNGETGERSDPVGVDQKKWLSTVRNKCKDTDCLVGAYERRIEAIRNTWLGK